VVYNATIWPDNKRELYAVPIFGGTPVQLTNLQPGADINKFEILPNNLGVVYTSDWRVEDMHEIYLVSILGGSSFRVSGRLVAGGSVQSFLITPDSLKAVYVADQEVDDKLEMFVSLEGFGTFLPMVRR
jgi:hypothetical protein